MLVFLASHRHRSLFDRLIEMFFQLILIVLVDKQKTKILQGRSIISDRFFDQIFCFYAFSQQFATYLDKMTEKETDRCQSIFLFLFFFLLLTMINERIFSLFRRKNFWLHHHLLLHRRRRHFSSRFFSFSSFSSSSRSLRSQSMTTIVLLIVSRRKELSNENRRFSSLLSLFIFKRLSSMSTEIK